MKKKRKDGNEVPEHPMPALEPPLVLTSMGRLQNAGHVTSHYTPYIHTLCPSLSSAIPYILPNNPFLGDVTWHSPSLGAQMEAHGHFFSHLLWFLSVPIGVLRITSLALAIPSWKVFSAAALCLRILSSSASFSILTVRISKEQH